MEINIIKSKNIENDKTTNEKNKKAFLLSLFGRGDL